MKWIIFACCLAFASTICAAFWLVLCKAAANADRRMEGELAKWLKANKELK